VVAQPAAHVERPHPVGAHVAEGHWRPGLRLWSAKAAAVAHMPEAAVGLLVRGRFGPSTAMLLPCQPVARRERPNGVRPAGPAPAVLIMPPGGGWHASGCPNHPAELGVIGDDRAAGTRRSEADRRESHRAAQEVHPHKATNNHLQKLRSAS
jgi:hypothetical protein